MVINVAHIEPQSYIYGPGARFVIWLQGCSLRCEGCWNKDMWPSQPRFLYHLDELFTLIKNHREDIEGITLLGGEPLDQYDASSALAKLAQRDGLSVMLFTGYELTELETDNKQGILSYVDILITGRYQEALRTLEHQWIGSTNQEIHFLSDKYDPSLIADTNYIEIQINEEGALSMLGFPNNDWIMAVEDGGLFSP